MAIYNEILSARFARLVQKLFSMKGGNPTKQISGEVMCVLPFFTGVENRYLESWQRFAITLNITGAAGQFATFRMRNPLPASPAVSTGVVAVIESILLGGGASPITVDLNLGVITTDLATPMGPQRLDPRGASGGGQMPTLVISNQTTSGSATTPNVGLVQLPATTPFQMINDENQEITILPGDALTVGAGTAATQLILTVIWRERLLEESERF